jgi:hypothetical protein
MSKGDKGVFAREFPYFMKFSDPDATLRFVVEKFVIEEEKRLAPVSPELAGYIQQEINGVRSVIDECSRASIDASRESAAASKASCAEAIRSVAITSSKTTSKGAIGERGAYEILKEAGFDGGDWNTAMVSNTAKSGDIRLNYRGGVFSCLIDPKNYNDKKKSNVGEAEVVKLKRDMLEQDVCIGILPSLHTGVVHRGDCDIEFFTDDKGRKCAIGYVFKLVETPTNLPTMVRCLKSVWEDMQSTPSDHSRSVLTERSKEKWRELFESFKCLDRTERILKSVQDACDGLGKQVLDGRNSLREVIRELEGKLRDFVATLAEE